jgi:hypothetical protein
MKLAVKLFALAMIVAPIGFMGAGTNDVSADDGPAGYCAPAPAYGPNWAPPGTCVNMPWGSLRCLNGSPYGHWEGFMYRDCNGNFVRYF